MQIRAEPEKSALSICNYSQILYQFFKFTQNLKQSPNPHTLAESVSLHSVCHDAIYFEYSYNLVHLLQSKDRIHRLGLPEGQYTQYFYLQSIFKNYLQEDFSMDEQVYLRLMHKEEVMLNAIDNNELEPVYTPEEDLELIFKNMF